MRYSALFVLVCLAVAFASAPVSAATPAGRQSRSLLSSIAHNTQVCIVAWTTGAMTLARCDERVDSAVGRISSSLQSELAQALAQASVSDAKAAHFAALYTQLTAEASTPEFARSVLTAINARDFAAAVQRRTTSVAARQASGPSIHLEVVILPVPSSVASTSPSSVDSALPTTPLTFSATLGESFALVVVVTLVACAVVGGYLRKSASVVAVPPLMDRRLPAPAINRALASVISAAPQPAVAFPVVPAVALLVVPAVPNAVSVVVVPPPDLIVESIVSEENLNAVEALVESIVPTEAPKAVEALFKSIIPEAVFAEPVALPAAELIVAEAVIVPEVVPVLYVPLEQVSAVLPPKPLHHSLHSPAAAASALADLPEEAPVIAAPQSPFVASYPQERAAYVSGALRGQGTYGQVFEVALPRPGADPERLALKVISLVTDVSGFGVIPPDEPRIHQLLSSSPHVPAYKTHFYSGDDLIVVMELAEGPSFTSFVREHRSLMTASNVAFLLRQPLQALKEMHSRGIFHRDFKPHNLLVMNALDAALTSGPRISLMDFGLAIEAKSHPAEVNHPLYRAPENDGVAGVTSAVDIWAFGLTLEALFTKGCVPEAAKPVIAACLQMDPALRPTAADLLELDFFKLCNWQV